MDYKLVCFDLDGTLVDGTEFIWKTLHTNLGIDPVKTDQAMKDYFNGQITYKEWFENDLKLWNEKGITKGDLLNAIKDINPHEGALETLQKLKNNGLKIAIVSGSIDLVLKKTFGIHQSLFDDVFINKIKFGEGGKIIGGTHTPFDMEHKATGLKLICEKEGITPEECVFVGDNHNDREIAKMAGLSIAFNCKDQELSEICDVVIEKKDLREILPYILKK